MRPVSNTIVGRPGAVASAAAIAAGEWHLRLMNDSSVAVDNTDMRLVHRDIQASKILHGCSPLHDGGADPIGIQGEPPITQC